MTSIIVLILAATTTAHANSIRLAPSPRPQATVGGGGASDVLNSTKSPPAAKHKSLISAGCTDRQGRRLKAGDAGYNECLADAQTQNKAAPVAPQTPPGSQMNLQFGQ